ncbi:hypothetical protein GUITHDRAFT_152104 [Guillardia theta CCMP2712]|uniref:Anti-proliferative protein domain-containing protein n=1 Tax=Guillardia theta (strain CCMP2712) TaxID=905079 RepID=L1JH39_GUITC|nr:hypothetical protein GUITHDRAFT_152104 [Guillardia theta CCMP2712]EKX47410.1 hypothetical protein GUITHDRAFT_152104 [Guillardia theta CCMP2712]|mmetsp:Transcript_50085/g.156733  ORF Transcript_50085/g.156733 Transcript_50085/m.156733 type:complete len:210 (-) Transcript_50085:153-782(-)|eukprot:XP_005834390.1 hypothetical protein GUITHDRAFT_152104 [Guillardia theta CCMP2712]
MLVAPSTSFMAMGRAASPPQFKEVQSAWSPVSSPSSSPSSAPSKAGELAVGMSKVSLDLSSSSIAKGAEPTSPGVSSSPYGPGIDEDEGSDVIPWDKECRAAASWWAGHLSAKVDEKRLRNFEDAVQRRVAQRCSKFWFTSEPARASGFRSVLNSPERCDPLLVDAARAAGINKIETLLPCSVLWVDPSSVRYKMDNSSYSIAVRLPVD